MLMLVCFGTSPRLQSLSNLTSIEVAGCVSLVDNVKLLGVTFDKHLNFDKHNSNICSSSYCHIRAFRQIRPFIDSEMYCAIVGSILDYVDSISNSISSRNSYRLQRVHNSLARVVTRSTTKTTSARSSLHWLPIQQRIHFKLAILVHRVLHNARPQYLSSLLQPSLRLPRSPLTSSYQHCSRLPWFSTCWTLSLEFPPS